MSSIKFGRMIKILSRPRHFTQARYFTQGSQGEARVLASLRTSLGGVEQVEIDVAGAPDYTVIVSRSVGCALAARDLGPKTANVDLTFYGGRHFASGIRLILLWVYIARC